MSTLNEEPYHIGNPAPDTGEIAEAVNDNYSRITQNDSDISDLISRIDTLELELAAQKAKVDKLLGTIKVILLDELGEKGTDPQYSLTLQEILDEDSKNRGYYTRKDGKRVYAYTGKKARKYGNKIIYDRNPNIQEDRILTLIGYANAMNINSEYNDKLETELEG